MALTILSVAYPLAPVGPDAVGGAEQILSALDAAFVARGHRSLVVAAEGSCCRGELIAVPCESGPLDEAARRRARAETLRAIERALADYRVDLVHLHGIDFAEYLPTTTVPLLATLHLPPSWYPPEIFCRPRAHLVCVSRSQLADCPPSHAVLGYVSNGIDLAQFRPSTPGPEALALGRICPEKGFHHAARAARLAGVPLLIAGQLFDYEAHTRYFREVLVPELDEARRFIGPAGLDAKRELLAQARCLLAPSLEPETSSLVAMEALASGTPVIAFEQGALPEVVRHGSTGFLVKDEAEMARAIAEIDRLDRSECRRDAEQRFPLERMVDGYLRTYEAVLERSRPPRMRRTRLQVELADALPTSTAMREEWEALWSACPSATIFQHPQWALAWAEAYRPPEVRFATARVDDRLVAAAPLLIFEEQGRRVLTPIGAGLADYGGLLALAEAVAAVAALLEVFEHEGDWDELRFEQLQPDDLLLRVAAPRTVAEAIAPGEACPVLPLAGKRLEDFVPARFAARVRYDQRRIGRTGNAAWIRADASSAQALFDELARLHRLRWSARGEAGVLDERALAFHRALVARFAGTERLLLDALSIDGRVVAAVYGFRAHGLSVYYLGGFDPALGRLSPSVALLGWTIEQELRAGAAVFDFLRGREPYKYAWGASDRPTFRRVLVRRARGASHYAATGEVSGR